MFEADTWSKILISQYGTDAIDFVEAARAYDDIHPGLLNLCRDLSDYLGNLRRIPTELRAFTADPLARDLLFGLIAQSRFGFDIVLNNHRIFWQIIQSREHVQRWGRTEMLTSCRRKLAHIDHYETRIDALIYFQHYHILRILLGDIGDFITFETIIRELSDLTDVCCEIALDLAKEKYHKRFGTANDGLAGDNGFVVFGMGKLGGGELNYSSDIDLIFLYKENGVTVGGKKSIDHHDYYKRVGAEFIRILDERHDSGRLYRVDMRLRPDGNSGELVSSYSEMLNYYYSVGRHWERQAMIKARPVAGDRDLGERLLLELQPWIYSTRIAWSKLEESRNMRRRIEDQAQEEDLKAGVGGIRDIEFLVQYLQLIYGGRYKNLRGPTTIPALHALSQESLLPQTEVTELIEHYTWLRMVEHRLQMWESRQLHEVPTDEADVLILAHRCGMQGEDAGRVFLAQLAQVRERVREIANQYYLRGTPEKDALIALILDDSPPQEVVDSILSPVSFLNRKRALRVIRSLAEEPFFILSRARTESNLIDILPSLLVLLQCSPEPDQTLFNFSRIVGAVGGRSYFYKTLSEHPELLVTLVTFSAWANFLIVRLERFSGLTDDLFEHIDPNNMYENSIREEANSLIIELQDPGLNLAYIQSRELLRIAIHDIRGEDHLAVCRALSALASDVMTVAFEFCARQLAERWGWPEHNGVRSECVILGLGKLGTGELTYASDMDIMYVCDDHGICTQKDRDASDFWTRVVQKMAAMLEDNKIYEVDPRLRPWGDQGSMVVSLITLADYWSKPRALWERMAMTRVNVLCSIGDVSRLSGEHEIGEKAVSIIMQAVCNCAVPDDAAEQIHDMRQRMENSVGQRDHLKRGRGGYVDVEFIAQYLLLTCDADDMQFGMGVRACLSYLHRRGKITLEECENLQESLRILRGIESRMRLSAGRAVSGIPKNEGDRLALAQRCNYSGVEELNRKIDWARGVARPLFDSLIS